jgi:hypothetical protein
LRERPQPTKLGATPPSDAAGAPTPFGRGSGLNCQRAIPAWGSSRNRLKRTRASVISPDLGMTAIGGCHPAKAILRLGARPVAQYCLAGSHYMILSVFRSPVNVTRKGDKQERQGGVTTRSDKKHPVRFFQKNDMTHAFVMPHYTRKATALNPHDPEAYTGFLTALRASSTVSFHERPRFRT